MVWGRDELEGVPTLEGGVEQGRGAGQGHHQRTKRSQDSGGLSQRPHREVGAIIHRQRGRGEDIAAGVQTLGDASCRRLLIWDNAPPHQARIARGAAEALGIEIVKLPFRSPELNPLEDLWRSLKAVVAANRVYGSVEELAERAVDYLDDLSEDDVLRLSGLLSSKFNWLPT